MSKKSPFFPIFGFGAIFWGLVRVADTISWKSEKYVRGYSSGVPKKPWMNKFEQTRERKIGGMECQKNAYFWLWAIFRGLVRPSDTNFLKNEKYARGYSSRLPKTPHTTKFEQTCDQEIWGNFATKITYFSLKKPQKWPKKGQISLLSQNDFRYINSASKWINKTKIMVGYFGRTDGHFEDLAQLEVEKIRRHTPAKFFSWWTEV